MKNQSAHKISVLCATAPKPNPGMSSVDLAFHAFASRKNLSDQVTFYQYILSPEIHSGKKLELLREIQQREKLPITYHSYRDRLEEIYNSDVIIFWGDFTHIHAFTRIISERLMKVTPSISKKEAMDSVYNHLFFENAPESVLNKTIIFGESLLFNGISCHEDERYKCAMQRLLNNSAGVFMRDPISAMDAQHLSGRYNHPMLGVDCSQLLTTPDIDRLPRSKDIPLEDYQNKIGVFFGRSDENISDLGRFSKYISRSLKKECIWIPWWYSRGSSKDLKKSKRGNRKIITPTYKTPPLVGDLYQMIKSCELIITDTYHLALNSWKMGIPAICIGQGYSKNKKSVNSGPNFTQRDKRQIFYFAHQLTDFFSYSEEVSSRALSKDRIEHILGSLENKPLINEKVRAIRSHASQVEENLYNTITKLLTNNV